MTREKQVCIDTLYGKAILYLYPNIDNILARKEKLITKVIRRAYQDTITPAVKQCEKIVELKQEISLYKSIKERTEEILSTYTKEQILLLDRKYFKLNTEESDLVNYKERDYFRKQISLAKNFTKAFFIIYQEEDIEFVFEHYRELNLMYEKAKELYLLTLKNIKGKGKK